MSESVDLTLIHTVELMDRALNAFLPTTHRLNIESSKGDPFADTSLTIHDQNRHCWKGVLGHNSIEGIGLRAAGIKVATELASDDIGNIADTYVRNMIHTMRGYPLWAISPSWTLPLERRRRGFVVGDVGIIQSSGVFTAYFNIFQPADHPLHEFGVPADFHPFTLSAPTVSKRSFYGGASIASPSMRVTHTENTEDGKYSKVTFEDSGSQGAVLVLPCGITSEDLEDLGSELRPYITDNIFSWYVYLRKMGHDLFNGDIRIVIGTDKTTGWCAAASASPDGISKDDFRVTFTTNNTNEGVSCTYQSSGSWYEVTGGPNEQYRAQIREPGDSSTDFCCETLFLRTLNPMLSDTYWEACQTVDTMPRDSTLLISRGLSALMTILRPVGRLPISLFGLVWKSDRQKTDPADGVIDDWVGRRRPEHPSNTVNERLLRKKTGSKMVFTTDYEWINAMSSADWVLPDMPRNVFDRILDSRPNS
ncbi:hypothetical protein D9619_008055 [Psilocybe cf. subviscida]|uniref:Uncharacterized protein n=1 Tax=Psilocybe cf. subviscida TaxID=2480587 RepID=A0A8H5AUA8_9AGAR|nr:hypothetical protein D9619_008055 [Psilocybe cf. subviscida]